jgi:hypothetical protein
MEDLNFELKRQELLRVLIEALKPGMVVPLDRRILRIELAGVCIATATTPPVGIEQAIARIKAKGTPPGAVLKVSSEEISNPWTTPK